MTPEPRKSTSAERPSMMLLDSTQLTAAATRLRDAEVPSAILLNGVRVTPAQLNAAAQILREAEPSVVTAPRRLRSVQERPGFIARERQEDDSYLVFDVGILPSATYRINPDGSLLDA